MLGIIVTGHGTFASGLTANMELIIGSQTAYCGVDFVDGDSVDDLAQKLKQATSRLASCDGILIFTDLLNGSPFNICVQLALADSRIRLVYGVNASMLLESCSQRWELDTVDKLAEMAVSIGRRQIGLFIPTLLEEEEL